MLRLSKLTDYAIVIMAYLAQHPGLAINAKTIAEHTGIALPTASKLLKRLSHDQLLFANRGVKGGYQLALLATDISLGQLIQTLEGQIALTECNHTALQCTLERQCRIGAFIQNTLMQISLADLISPLNLMQLEALLKTTQPLHFVPENTP